MKHFMLDGEYQSFLTTLGFDVGAALRRAELPEDTFAHMHVELTAEAYFAFIESLARQMKSPDDVHLLRCATKEPIAPRVCTALVELLPSGEGTIEGVSRMLGMSRRTLQRHLKDEGVTFQQQLSAVRERLARHYVESVPMTTDEMAYLLGYDETNSFLRAFKSWTGQSISSYRNEVFMHRS